MENEFFQEWLFQYNPYTKEWSAFRREHNDEYWNNKSSPNIVSHKDIATLISTMKIVGPDIRKIKKVLNGK